MSDLWLVLERSLKIGSAEEEIYFSPLMRWEDRARDLSFLELKQDEIAAFKQSLPEYQESNLSDLDPFVVQQEFLQKFSLADREGNATLKKAYAAISILIFKKSDGMQLGVEAYDKVLTRHRGELSENFFSSQLIEDRWTELSQLTRNQEKTWFDQLDVQKKTALQGQGSKAIETAFQQEHPEYQRALLYLKLKADVQVYVNENAGDYSKKLHKQADTYLDVPEKIWAFRMSHPGESISVPKALESLSHLESQIWRRYNPKQQNSIVKKERMVAFLRGFNQGLTQFEEYDAQNASFTKVKTYRNIPSIPFYMSCALFSDQKNAYEECRDEWAGDVWASEAALSAGEVRSQTIERFEQIIIEGITSEASWVLDDDFLQKAFSKLSAADQTILNDQLAFQDLMQLSLLPCSRERVKINASNMKIAEAAGMKNELIRMTERDLRDLYLLTLAEKALNAELGSVDLTWSNRSITKMIFGTPNLLWGREVLEQLSDPKKTESQFIREKATALLLASSKGDNSWLNALWDLVGLSKESTPDEFTWGIEGDLTRFALTFLGGYGSGKSWRRFHGNERVGTVIRTGLRKFLLKSDDEFRWLFARIPFFSLRTKLLTGLHAIDELKVAIQVTRNSGAEGFKIWAKQNPKEYLSLSPSLRKSLARGEIPQEAEQLLNTMTSRQALIQDAWEIKWAKENPKKTKVMKWAYAPVSWASKFDDGLTNLVTHPGGMGVISAYHGVQKLNPIDDSLVNLKESVQKGNEARIPQDPVWK